ncbi:putative UDP-N-acetylglucosamine--peptide N-acetylglucosaminyltransferase SPINDLY, partial [Tetrabaena socialis]
GHTANNRLGVLARRPAPLQLTWIGYPNSTGLEAVDYRLTDAVCDPWDTQQTFVEELVRMPGCFLCYTPAADAPPVSPPPVLANGYVTFGSFNNLAKITPQVLRVWAAILAAVPGSRLVLKNKPFACEAARAHLLRQLAALGVEPWRVDLLPLVPGNAPHLATYGCMDISLDPFPYAGGSGGPDNIERAVECYTAALTIRPTFPQSLNNLGVVMTAQVRRESPVEKQYKGRAAEALALLTAAVTACPTYTALRPRMLASPMCDAPAFTRRLEGVYRQLWRRHCAARAAAGQATAAVATETAVGPTGTARVQVEAGMSGSG